MKQIFDDLENLNYYSLRVLAKEIGVKAPSKLTKAQIIQEISLIKSGVKEPYVSTKGRPAKPNLIKDNIFVDVNACLEKDAIKKSLIKNVVNEIEKWLYVLLKDV